MLTNNAEQYPVNLHILSMPTYYSIVSISNVPNILQSINIVLQKSYHP